MGTAKRVTIYEIAKKAGVSTATVSRALNSDYPVSVEVRERIEKAVKDLNYRTNTIARSLRNRKSNLMAIVIPDITNPFFMEAAKGVEQAISEHGYGLVLSCTEGSITKEHRLIDSLVDRMIDGLIVASSDQNGDFLKRIEQNGIPIVLIDRPLTGSGLTKIIWDNKEGARRITNYLISKNHTRIGIINVSLENQNGRDRLAGFVQAMKEAGIDVCEEFVSPSNFTRDDSYAWSCSILKKPVEERPSAIFCANNVMLAGLLKACQELGVVIGDDLSIVSFGYSDMYWGPQITSLYQDSLYMGRLAGEKALSLIGDGQSRGRSQDVILIPELQEGDSVKVL